MRRHDAKKVARLRTGESNSEGLAPVGDPNLEELHQLRALDERVEAAGFSPVLGADERRIVDSGLDLGRIDCVALAKELGVHRTTIWRRVRRLLAIAPSLHRHATTLLREDVPQDLRTRMAMIKTYAWAGVGERPEGALDIHSFNKLTEMYRAGSAAFRLLYPLSGLQFERRGEKVIITGSGTLSPKFQEAVRTGTAVRIYDPPRCHTCGQFVSRPRTGRRPKYCSERCRSRYRRRS